MSIQTCLIPLPPFDIYQFINSQLQNHPFPMLCENGPGPFFFLACWHYGQVSRGFCRHIVGGMILLPCLNVSTHQVLAVNAVFSVSASAVHVVSRNLHAFHRRPLRWFCRLVSLLGHLEGRFLVSSRGQISSKVCHCFTTRPPSEPRLCHPQGGLDFSSGVW